LIKKTDGFYNGQILVYEKWLKVVETDKTKYKYMAKQTDFEVTIGNEKTFITTVIQENEKLSIWMAILTPKGLKQFRIDSIGCFDPYKTRVIF